jgi:hypothetical protein
MTHTFYNLMKNPVATLCFQGTVNIFTSFELRCIAKIVHPQDPNLSEEEKDIIEKQMIEAKREAIFKRAKRAILNLKRGAVKRGTIKDLYKDLELDD